MWDSSKSYRAHSMSDPQMKANMTSSSFDTPSSPSTRLWDRVGNILSNPNDPEGIKELVVVAFGAFERYYVCWLNEIGEYRQDSYGLPPELKEWLFPADGSCRDFKTLQVSFGHGNEYFASDKDGKISNMDTSADLRNKFSELAGSQDPARLSLRRQHTLSLTDLDRDPKAAIGLVSESLTPTRLQRRNTSRPLRRPVSVTMDRENIWTWIEKRPERERVPEYSQRHLSIPLKRRSSYVDACVQTESDSVSSDVASTKLGPELHIRHSILQPVRTENFDSFISNPIAMGKMQTYFRASRYRLGDALQTLSAGIVD